MIVLSNTNLNPIPAKIRNQNHTVQNFSMEYRIKKTVFL